MSVGGLFTVGGDLSLSIASLLGDTEQRYQLFNFGSVSGTFASVSIGGTYTASLTSSGGLWTGSGGGRDFYFDTSAGELVVAAIPEPASLPLLVGAGALLSARLRRRRVA